MTTPKFKNTQKSRYTLKLRQPQTLGRLTNEDDPLMKTKQKIKTKNKMTPNMKTTLNMKMTMSKSVCE